MEKMTAARRLGAVAEWRRDGQRVIFACADGAQMAVSVLGPALVRVRVAPEGAFAPVRSWSPARADADFPPTDFRVEETPHSIVIATAVVTLRVERTHSHMTVYDADGRIVCDDAGGATWQADGRVAWAKRIPANEHYYGFGERTGLLDKRSHRMTNWTKDRGDHGPVTDAMYQATPVFMALRPGEALGYGIYFNNSHRSVFDMGRTTPGTYTFSATGGELDYYLFYGPTPAQIVAGYTAVTGRMPLPPRWALGYQQSRYSYYPETAVREVAQEFRRRAIPCDAVVLDIDYMDEYRLFTWDEEHFPGPAALIAELATDGFKLVTIVDPGVKNEPGYMVYDSGVVQDAFVRDPATGEPATGYVWPGESVFPDFSRADVRAWWGRQHTPLLARGVAGIWNDMNEPAIFDANFGVHSATITPIDLPADASVGAEATPTRWAEIHNLYGQLEDMATYAGLRAARPDARPFVLTRSGFAGIQRYAAVWTGDNMSVWEHLDMALPMLCNMGLSGIAFCGTDIGGFQGNATGELYARWMQFGVLSPFARGHTASDTDQHEPWVFGAEVEAICRRYLELRYRLLPYLYSLFDESARTGAPLLRPLLYHFPDDTQTAELHDEAMLGDALLFAPVTAPGRQYRYVYLPAGVWYDFWGDGTAIVGPTHLLAHAPLDTLPLYVRGGSIVAFGPTLQHTGQHDPAAPLTLRLYPDAEGNAACTLYEDAGEGYAYQQGGYRRSTITCRRSAANTLHIAATSEGSYRTGRTQVIIRLPNGTETSVSVTDDAEWAADVAEK